MMTFAVILDNTVKKKFHCLRLLCTLLLSTFFVTFLKVDGGTLDKGRDYYFT